MNKYFKISKNIIMNIKSTKLRVFLSSIGIIIGISSVSLIMSIGNSFEKHINQQFKDQGGNKLTFSIESLDYQTNRIDTFNKEQKDAINLLDNVISVEEPNKKRYKNSYFEGNRIEVSIENKKKSSEGNVKILFGENITEQDIINENNVIVINMDTFDKIKKIIDISEKEIIGKYISINTINFEIIGISNNESSVTPYEITSVANETNNTFSINVVVKKKTEEIKNKILDILNDNNEKVRYVYIDNEEISKVLSNVVKSITFFISLIASISIFVGGVGIMNMMYLTVSERKKEIGIKRSIGAQNKDILMEFLLESIFVTFFAGITGVIITISLILLINTFSPFPINIEASIIILNIIISMSIGAIFGIIPAMKASKQNIIGVLK